MGRAVPDRVLIACGLAWGAALIHVQAAIEHIDEYPLFAIFFAILAPAQLAWGTALYRSRSRRLLTLGAAASIGIVALWIASRTTGLPIGPTPWIPEPVGIKDSIASADELLLALVVVAHLHGASHGVFARGWRYAADAASLGLILLSSLSFLVIGHAH